MTTKPAAIRFVVRHDVRPHVPFLVRVFRGRKAVGHCIVEEARPGSNAMQDVREGRCAAALRAAEQEVGRPLRVFLVLNSALDEAEHNTGLGVAMYARAVAEAAALGGVLIPSHCKYEHGGSTSRDALRVWASRRFAAAVAVFDGRVAYGGAEIAPGARTTALRNPAAKSLGRRGQVPMVQTVVAPLLARYGAIIRPLRDLPLTAQLAVGAYVRNDGRDTPATVAKRMGAVPFGYVELPMAVLTSLIGAYYAAQKPVRFHSFDEFHRDYAARALMPDHALINLWPVILERPEPHMTLANEGVMEDGWHRLNDYYRKGVETVPAVFFVGKERFLR